MLLTRSEEYPRHGHSSPRNIHVAAAAASRLVSTEYLPSRPRPRRGSSPQNIHVAAAAASRLSRGRCQHANAAETIKNDLRVPLVRRVQVDDVGTCPEDVVHRGDRRRRARHPPAQQLRERDRDHRRVRARARDRRLRDTHRCVAAPPVSPLRPHHQYRLAEISRRLHHGISTSAAAASPRLGRSGRGVAATGSDRPQTSPDMSTRRVREHVSKVRADRRVHLREVLEDIARWRLPVVGRNQCPTDDPRRGRGGNATKPAERAALFRAGPGPAPQRRELG